MAFIQRHQQLWCRTFHQLQGNYLKQLLSTRPDKCNCINFVGDRYDVSTAESLKGEKREKREKARPGRMKEYKPHDALAIPDWKDFVQNPANKANLLEYLGEAWLAEHEALTPECTII